MVLLDGKVALITGAASGIGRCTAIRFAEEGAKVALADVSEEEGANVAREIEKAGGDAFFLHCDVSDPESVRKAFEATAERFGRLDVVMANAGINGVWAPIDELLPTEWDRTLDINLKGTYLTLHFAVPHLKRAGGGSIIVISSVNGNRTFSNPGAHAYSASKAGQIALAKMAALELGRHDIRVNAVCPGYVPTNIEGTTEKRETERIAIDVRMPKGSPALNAGVGQPEDVADTCVFLASDLSRHVSGTEIYVDGGASLLR